MAGERDDQINGAVSLGIPEVMERTPADGIAPGAVTAFAALMTIDP